jgi:DNA-binding MarR family transcriptional regulator/N-acetylglutamate synthase-like GNAT family acetyltransferase
MSSLPTIQHRIDAVRRFNRFYTRQIGVLQEHILKSAFSLTEARLIYELAHRQEMTPTSLATELQLDPGYVSRLLRTLRRRRLIAQSRSARDGRQILVTLTSRGKDEFTRLNNSSGEEIEVMLRARPEDDQMLLVDAMEQIERALAGPSGERVSYILRAPQPGDFGWVVHRHGVLYAQEYAWDERFEALVAQIVADFVASYNSKCDRCWIAERNGKNVGSVFVVKKSSSVAKLRLLLVEPDARGLGIGARLVDECIRFARQAGYDTLTLWTNDVLHAARRIYENAGFVLVNEERHHSFGKDLVGQTWQLTL